MEAGIVFIIVGTYMFLHASIAHNLILAAKDLELSSGSGANELQRQTGEEEEAEADIKSVWVANVSYLFNVLFRVPIKMCHATFHSTARTPLILPLSFSLCLALAYYITPDLLCKF